MIEVAPGLYLHPGPPDDAELKKLNESDEWAILSAALDPWFRKAPVTGTNTPSLFRFYNDNWLCLALIDSADGYEYSEYIMTVALAFITTKLDEGKNVLVHCNMGMSRSPSIAMLYMAHKGLLPPQFEYAMLDFKEIYPSYDPGPDIRAYVKRVWKDYVHEERVVSDS